MGQGVLVDRGRGAMDGMATIIEGFISNLTLFSIYLCFSNSSKFQLSNIITTCTSPNYYLIYAF